MALGNARLRGRPARALCWALLGVLLGLPGLRGAEPDAGTDKDMAGLLTFTNGDCLTGRLVRCDPPVLTWAGGELQAPILVGLGGVREIFLRGVREKADGDVQVILTNADALYGDLVSLDARTLKVRTSYAGTLDVRRASVASIRPSVQGRRALELGKLCDWVIKSAEWRIEDGRLLGSGGAIGRYLNLPASVEIEAEVTWQTTPDFSIIVHAEPNRYSSVGYNACVQGTSVSMSRGTQQSFGAGVHSFQRDRRKAIVNVGAGGSGGSDVEPRASTDVFFFTCGDRLTGHVKAIRDGHVDIETAYGPVHVDLGEISLLRLKGDIAAVKATDPNDVQLAFAVGGNLNVRMASVAQGVLSGRHPAFGACQLRLGVFGRITWFTAAQPRP